MLRLIAILALILALAFGAAWLADQPGAVTIAVGGWEVSTNLFVAGVALALFAIAVVVLWLAYHWLTDAPAVIGSFFRARRQRRGVEALSRGLIAAGAGDAGAAAREAALAEKLIGDVALTRLLRAQTAQMKGDEAAARTLYERMLADKETEILGLRGLFLQAREAGDAAGARVLAERAAARGPEVAWASLAQFELEAAAGDWAGALKTLEARRRHKLVDRPAGNRLAAVLRTAQAQQIEGDDAAAALDHAIEAHRLDPGLVAASVIAARLLAEKGDPGRAARIVEETWKANPHPDLAAVYAFLRPGDGPRERLARIRTLAGRTSDHPEGAIATARACLEARDFTAASAALETLAAGTPSQRVCTLMAEIEAADNGDHGRVREWLARAVNAPADPAWTADGVVSADWRPVSPVTGRLDAFEWRVPVEGVAPSRLSPALIAAAPREAQETAPASEAAPATAARVVPLSEGVTRDEAAKEDRAAPVVATHQPDDPGVVDDEGEAPAPGLR